MLDAHGNLVYYSSMTLLTVQQAADELGITRQAVHLLLGNGRLVIDERIQQELGVFAIDSEQVAAEKQRRVERAKAQIEALGYTVVLSPQ